MTTPVLTLMRGIPGSGKSTFARQFADAIVKGGATAIVISTDDYFMSEGMYLFDRGEIPAAHAWNQKRCAKLMGARVSQIFVDNTNIHLWEMREYVKLALKHGYDVGFSESQTPWAKDPEECFKRNGHGCPLDAVYRMAETFEDLPQVFYREQLALIVDAKAPWETRAR